MSKKWNLRQMSDADWPQVRAFAIKHFGPSHAPDQTFNTYWFKRPDPDNWTARVLEDQQGKLVGVMMVILVKAKFGNESAPLAWISSAAVEPEVQAVGGGAQFFLWVYKSFPLVGAMSGNEESLPLNNMLGHDIPGVKMRRFIRIHDKKAFDLCKSPISQPSIHSAKPTRQWEWSDQLPSDYIELWSRVRSSFFCVVDRDNDFMTWRFKKAPYVDYSFLCVRKENQLVGVAVVRIQSTPQGNVARVVDMVSEDQDGAVWEALSAAVIEKKALFSDFMVIGTHQDKALQQGGFLPANATTGLNAVPHLLSPVEHREWSNTFHLGGELAKSNFSWRRPEAIYFTKADSDRDWPTSYDLSKQKVEVA